jgi:hypothetical protein
VKPLAEIRKAWADIPTYPAVAVRGEGVIETFRELLRRLYRHLEQKHQLNRNFGITEDEFLAGVFKNAAKEAEGAAAAG